MEGTPDFVDHRTIADYVKGIAWRSNQKVRFLYNTRVEKLEKDGGNWKIRSKTLKALPNGHLQKKRTTQVSMCSRAARCGLTQSRFSTLLS